MMTFKQFLTKGARLNEGFIRSAGLLAWANKSKVNGESAAALQDDKQTLLAGKSAEFLGD